MVLISKELAEKIVYALSVCKIFVPDSVSYSARKCETELKAAIAEEEKTTDAHNT